MKKDRVPRRVARVTPQIERGRANRATLALGPFRNDLALQAAFRDDLRKFFDANGRKPPSDISLRRYVKRIPYGSEFEDIAARWVEERLVDLLRSLEVVDDAKIEDVRRIVAAEPFGYEAMQLHSSPSASKRRGSAKAALDVLLGMSPTTDYQVTERCVGEYFGYRTSSNHGRIIRFFLEIELDGNTGLLRFQNRFHSTSRSWVTTGFGINVGDTLYLLGQARTNKLATGFRLFALKPYAWFDWVVGPLMTADDDLDPIAARVVLIPASQHVDYRFKTGDDRIEEMLRLIADEELTPQKLDAQIALKDADTRKNAFEKVPASHLIQALIWNASFTTLHARAGRVEPANLNRFQKLFEMKSRAIALMREGHNEFAPWLHLADNAEVALPISRSERSDYRSDRIP